MRRLSAVIAVFMGLAACSSAEDTPTVKALGFERTSANSIEQGRRLSAVLGCSGCHGVDLTGEDWSEPGFGRLWTSNLTRALPDYTDAQLATTIRTGRRPDGSELWGMPSFIFTQLSDEEMAAVIAYLRSAPAAGEAHPRPLFEAAAKAEIEAGTLKSAPAEVRETASHSPPDVGAEFAQGRYIVRATCAECHRMDLRGGVPYPGADPRPDLRMVTAYDIEQFDRLIRTGMPIGGRDLGLMGEVARGRYSHFTDAEVQAVHAYLQRVGGTPD